MFYSLKEIEYLIEHLREHGNTVINYNYVERFTLERIKEDLRELGFDCDVRIDTKDCPDSIYDFEYDHNRRIRVTYPILPCVIISWKEYNKYKVS